MTVWSMNLSDPHSSRNKPVMTEQTLKMRFSQSMTNKMCSMKSC